MGCPSGADELPQLLRQPLRLLHLLGTGVESDLGSGPNGQQTIEAIDTSDAACTPGPKQKG